MISNSRFINSHSPLALFKDLVSRDKRILVSISGGQDSMLLAWSVFQIQHEKNLSPNWLYHNHLWHTEGFFHGLHCWRLSVVFGWPFLYTLPFHSILDEEKGWIFRHHVRRRLCLFYSKSEILLGHTKTDRSESILFHLLRGSLFQFSPNTQSWIMKTPFLPEQRTASLKVVPLIKIERSPSNLFSLDRESLAFIPPAFSVSASRSIRMSRF